jgi:LPS-assembly lipoprotein
MGMNSQMRFSRVTQILVTCTLIMNLVACGFTPVYKEGSQSAQTLSDIQVAAPSTREDYLFVRNMEERLGRNDNAKLLLAYNIQIYSEGIELYGAARARQVGVVRYRLITYDNNTTIATGVVDSFTGYDTDGLGYLRNRRNATERLMQILTDKTITDIIIKLQTR